MRNIELNNGKIVTIGSNRDFLEVIDTNLSCELARYIERLLYNQEELDNYICDIEKKNDKLIEENNKLHETMMEYSDRKLWNDNYFDYLVKIGG